MAQQKNDYPTYLTLANMRGMTPQKQNLFEVKWNRKPTQFSQIDIKNLDPQQNLVDGISGTQSFIDNLWVFVQQVTLPNVTIDSGEIPMPLFNPKYQNKMTFGNFTITFNDPYGVPVTQFFEQWTYKLIQDPEKQGINLQTSYKQDILVNLYSGLEEDVTDPIFSYIIYGQYPSNIPQSNFDYQNTEQRTVEMTFSYDYFEVRLGGKYIQDF